MEIILASASPRRREILENAGIRFKVCPADVDETTDKTEPSEYVTELAKRKAEALDCGRNIIVAADTVVATGSEILGKPRDDGDAARMLTLLSGKAHQVYTAVSVRSKDKSVTFCEKTDVYFKELTKEQIDWYIKTGEPRDKAGAYAIQGKGAVFIKKIDGDYLNVIGLPLSRLYDVLHKNFEGFDKNE